VAALVLVAVATGCNASTRQAASGSSLSEPSSVTRTSLASSPSTTSSSATVTPKSTTTVDPRIAHPTSGIEFYSPTRNIHCEINYGAPYSDQEALCFTGDPAQSATVAVTGNYKTCSGQGCLANPAPDEVELPYGQNVVLGPFRCMSAATGMTCTANGKGFEISRAGIVAVS
jgi:hypothetical protein